MSSRIAMVAALASALSMPCATTLAQQQPPSIQRKDGAPAPPRKPDLGDAAAGSFKGEIISDSRGARSEAGAEVTLTIERIGVNRVRVISSHPALPGSEHRLEAAMGRLLTTSARSTLLIDPTQKPTKIDYSPDELISMSGVRQ